MDSSLGFVAWETLFGDKVGDMPDPNKPENQARLNAEQKERKEAFRRFANGPGKVFFEHVKYSLRRDLYQLVMFSEIDCNCALGNKIREIRIYLKMLANAEQLAKEA